MSRTVEVCPECDSTNCYHRDTKTPPWRCSNCGEEFQEPAERQVKSGKGGLPPGSDNPNRIPDDALKHDLLRVAAIIDGTPTIDQYREHGVYSGVSLRKRFGGWGEAIDTAGLERRGRHITKEQICEDIQRVSDELGRSPKIKEYEELGEYHPSSAIRRFGSWTEAVRAAGLEPQPQGTATMLADKSPEDLGLSGIGEQS